MTETVSYITDCDFIAACASPAKVERCRLTASRIVEAGGADLLEVEPCPLKATFVLHAQPDSKVKHQLREILGINGGEAFVDVFGGQA